MIKAETNIYDKFQTVIPKKIREKLGLTKDHVIEWIADENGKVELKFRKKINWWWCKRHDIFKRKKQMQLN